MKKILFLGFHRDYEKMEILSLSNEYYDFVDFCIPDFFLKIVTKIYNINDSFSFWMVNKFLRKKILNLNEYDLVITLDNIFYIEFLRDKDINKVVLFRNTYQKKFNNTLEGFTVYSFDKEDCKNYGFKKYNQFCSGFNYILNNKHIYQEQYDLSFVGLNKGRSEIINRLKSILKNKNTLFIIPDRKNFFVKILRKIKIIKPSMLSYTEYLNILLKSRFTLEVVKEGQTNETMRFIEALVAGKKVLTNNESIKQHELFDENSVHVVDFENEEEILNALASNDNSINEYPLDTLKKYSPQYFLNKVIDDNSK